MKIIRKIRWRGESIGRRGFKKKKKEKIYTRGRKERRRGRSTEGQEKGVEDL